MCFSKARSPCPRSGLEFLPCLGRVISLWVLPFQRRVIITYIGPGSQGSEKKPRESHGDVSSVDAPNEVIFVPVVHYLTFCDKMLEQRMERAGACEPVLTMVRNEAFIDGPRFELPW
eukprot:scaffold34601_cov234-Amphora_coffeaeformis.AAC.11